MGTFVSRTIRNLLDHDNLSVMRVDGKDWSNADNGKDYINNPDYIIDTFENLRHLSVNRNLKFINRDNEIQEMKRKSIQMKIAIDDIFANFGWNELLVRLMELPHNRNDILDKFEKLYEIVMPLYKQYNEQLAKIHNEHNET